MPADDTATTAAMARRGNDPARLAVRAAVTTAGMTPKQALLRPIVPKRPRPRAKIPEGYALTGIRLRVQLLPQSLAKRGDGQPFLTTKVAWLQGGGGAGAEAGAGTPAEAAQAAGGADAGAGARGPAAEAAAEGNG